MDSSRKRPRGPGAGNLASLSPLPLLSHFHCISKPQDTLTYIYPQAHHAGPRGRRTSPACGSCRRPLKKIKTKGSRQLNERKSEVCFAVPLRVYYARMRILRILCAEAHNAHMRMCAAAHYAHRRIMRRCVDAHIMRICAKYAYMRILCVDAQMMRICAECAYTRILRV